MKWIYGLTSLLLLIAPAANAAVEIGKPAPNIVAKDTNGNDVNLQEIKDKIVVLEWKNHECPFVKKHYASNNMQQLQAYAKEKDVVWMTIISSAEGKQGYVTAEEANKIAADSKASPTHIILDPKGEIGKAYDAKVTPHMYVIGKDKNLAYMGAIDDKPSVDPNDINGAKNYVRLAIDALLESKPVETATTTAYGCGVKY